MILKITNYCTMGCSHCIVNSTTEGKHMTKETFNNAIDFIKRVEPLVVLVSGGEPTDHPLFFEYINEIKKIYAKEQISILSNGLFLKDKEKAKRVLSLGCMIQITNDDRYYPIKIPKVNHPLIVYENNIRTLFPLGRAKNKNPIGVKAPGCFNIRSLVRYSNMNLHVAINKLESMMKFCCPMIGEDGNLYLGESTECKPVGSITSSIEELTNNIKTFRCNDCSMCNNLDFVQKMVIGEE